MLVAVVAVGGVAVYSVPGVSKPIKGWFAPAQANVMLHTVQAEPLSITVVDRGTLESSKNEDVYCNVEGGTTIISIKPEGSRVKKGEVVCELDSASLSDSLTNQTITTKSASSSYENAKLTREVAEIAVREYEEGTYVLDRATAEGEIKLAESELSRQVDRVDWARRMFDKGYVSLAAKNTEEFTLAQAKFKLEQSQGKLTVLTKYTFGKTIKELKSEVEKARSDELAKKATMELEISKENKLKRQIAACTLRAPNDGIVVYANDPTRAFGNSQPQVEEGATVRERQKIFSLPDITKMQVNAKIHESQIKKIAPGMKALVRVDALAEQELKGTVLDVAPLPDPTSFFSSDVKLYTCHVRIDETNAGLRPGMNSQVQITVEEKAKVLTVPVLALLEYGGKTHVTKKIGDRFEQTVVDLGPSNERFAEVTKGVAAGDVVVLNPISLMTEEEKRKAFGTTSDRGEGKGEGGPDAKGGPPGAAGTGAPGGPPGAAGKGDPAKAKGKGGPRGKGQGNPMFQKFSNLSPAERASMKTASPEEREALMRKAGFTDAEIEQMRQFRGGGGGGGGGGFGGGRRGGGGPGAPGGGQ